MISRAPRRVDNGAANAMNPDLSNFVDRGGKLIVYHGTTDGLIPYGNSVELSRECRRCSSANERLTTA